MAFIAPKFKTTENEDFARTSATGNATAPSPFPDEGRSPMCDLDGRLVVRQAGPGGFVVPTGVTSKEYNPTGYTELFQISAVDTYLSLIFGFNSSPILYWVQLFRGIIAPNPLDVPLVSIQVPGGASFSLEPITPGKFFQGGLAYYVSTTGPNYTASGVSVFWVNAEYLS